MTYKSSLTWLYLLIMRKMLYIPLLVQLSFENWKILVSVRKQFFWQTGRTSSTNRDIHYPRLAASETYFDTCRIQNTNTNTYTNTNTITNTNLGLIGTFNIHAWQPVRHILIQLLLQSTKWKWKHENLYTYSYSIDLHLLWLFLQFCHSFSQLRNHPVGLCTM